LWLLSPTTFDDTNDGWVATSRCGAEGGRSQFENNCKLCGKQNSKSPSDGARALCHEKLPSGFEREQPFHQQCGSKRTDNAPAEAQGWSILRRFILNCDHSVEIDADESRSGNVAREFGRQIGKSSKAFKRDSMKATISSTHNQ
jgi:hypothetical protein